MAEEMVIFTRTFDFLTWLLPATNHFPRAHRFTFTQRLLDAAFSFYEDIETANHRRGQDRITHLRLADEELDKVRIYLRLATKWGWLDGGQYQHVARMVTEIGSFNNNQNNARCAVRNRNNPNNRNNNIGFRVVVSTFFSFVDRETSEVLFALSAD